MTAVTEPRRAVARQRVLKTLAGVLGFVCIVLFLLAIEQKQAVEAWGAVRHGAVPAATRVAAWIGDGAADGLAGLKQAAVEEAPVAASPETMILAGEFAAADEATRQAVGGVAFVAGRVQFESGGTLQTRPLRIASAREVFVHGGPTFAARLDAPRDAQIELRQIVVSGQDQTVSSRLCAGHAPGAMALLHRRDRVDLMLFRERTIIGSDASSTALCGVWSFRGR